MLQNTGNVEYKVSVTEWHFGTEALTYGLGSLGLLTTLTTSRQRSARFKFSFLTVFDMQVNLSLVPEETCADLSWHIAAHAEKT